MGRRRALYLWVSQKCMSSRSYRVPRTFSIRFARIDRADGRGRSRPNVRINRLCRSYGSGLAESSVLPAACSTQLRRCPAGRPARPDPPTARLGSPRPPQPRPDGHRPLPTTGGPASPPGRRPRRARSRPAAGRAQPMCRTPGRPSAWPSSDMGCLSVVRCPWLGFRSIRGRAGRLPEQSEERQAPAVVGPGRSSRISPPSRTIRSAYFSRRIR